MLVVYDSQGYFQKIFEENIMSGCLENKQKANRITPSIIKQKNFETKLKKNRLSDLT